MTNQNKSSAIRDSLRPMASGAGSPIRMLDLIFDPIEARDSIRTVGGSMGQPDIAPHINGMHAGAGYFMECAGFDQAVGLYGTEDARHLFRILGVKEQTGHVMPYPPFPGFLTLRQAAADSISQRTGSTVDAGNVIITAGASEALVRAAITMVGPKDGADNKTLVISDPFFSAYPAFFGAMGTDSDMKFYVAKYGYPTPEEARNAIEGVENPVLLLNMSGTNPGGLYAPKSAVKEMAAMLAETGVPLISDELYWIFNPNKAERTCLLHEVNDEVRGRGFFIDGLSKSGGGPGLRQAALYSGDKDAISVALNIGVPKGFISPSAPAMKVYEAVLPLLLDVELQDKLAAHYSVKHDVMKRELPAEMLVTDTNAITGGPYFSIKMPEAIGKKIGPKTKEIVEEFPDLKGLLDERGGDYYIRGSMGTVLDLRAQYGVKCTFYDQFTKQNVSQANMLRQVLDGDVSDIRELATRLKLARGVYMGQEVMPENYPPRKREEPGRVVERVQSGKAVESYWWVGTAQMF